MRRQFLYINAVIMIITIFVACSDIRQAVGLSPELSVSTSIPSYSIESSMTTSLQNDPSDDPEYKKLRATMWNLRWGQASFTLSEMLAQFDNYVIREELTVPYAKVHLQNGYVAFLFYDGREELTDIWITNHFLTQAMMEELEIGKTTLRELTAMDLYSFHDPSSYESISAHIVYEGAYVVRCSYTNTDDVGVVNSIEFIANNEFNDAPVRRYGMIIPYILPEDRNTD